MPPVYHIPSVPAAKEIGICGGNEKGRQRRDVEQTFTHRVEGIQVRNELHVQAPRHAGAAHAGGEAALPLAGCSSRRCPPGAARGAERPRGPA